MNRQTPTHSRGEAIVRIDFLGLQAFLSIAERGSFHRAATHLNLSQTAISHRMRKLEDELGIKLFARTTREVMLTRAGIDFLPKAQKAIAELEQSFDELKQQGVKRRDRLDIACLPAFAVRYLPPILSKFRVAHPHVDVRIFETPSAAIAELVGSGDVEFGLSVIQTNRWDLEFETISQAPLALVCPPGHEFAKMRSVSWNRIRNTPLIRVGTKTAIRTIIDDAVAAAQLTPNWQYEVQHVETAIQFVEVGLGLAIAPTIDVTLHRGRKLKTVPLRSPKVVCNYGLVTRRGMPLSSSATMVRAYIVEELKNAA
jgi:DNA-binding transcriptional LysR family regulator